MPFQFRKEAIEEDLNSNFPSQGQGNPPLYYSLSEVVVPTYSINNVAEGSSLPENLQTAWDFSTGHSKLYNTTSTLISTPGFWQIDFTLTGLLVKNAGSDDDTSFDLSDGISSKEIWQLTCWNAAQIGTGGVLEDRFVVFLRSGDSLSCSASINGLVNVWYRQIATVNGELVNPLGFSAA
tara:strand:- start:242 stop:781 length:540 start_codon:yes stop_codon:yes gene_type:complete